MYTGQNLPEHGSRLMREKSLMATKCVGRALAARGSGMLYRLRAKPPNGPESEEIGVIYGKWR